MRFAITRLVIGCGDRVELTNDEFDTVVLARDGVVSLVDIEEKFDLVVQNYAEFERGLLELTTQQMLHVNFDYSSIRDDVGFVNRRLVNLLSACRLYVDQLKHDMSRLYGRRSAVLDSVKTCLSGQYDSRIGYELLEQLRNHMQHRALPVIGIGYHGSRDFTGDVSKYRKLTCVPKISVARLREANALKPSTISKMGGENDLLDIRPFVRDYMTGLGTVHTKVREIADADAERWEASLSGVITRFRDVFGGMIVGLAIVELDDRGCAVREVRVFADLADRYRELRRRNCFVQHYDTQFISSDCGWGEDGE